MKTNWALVVSIAALIVTGIGMLMSMNRIGETDAVALEARIVALERDTAGLERAGERRDVKFSGRFVFMRETAQIVEYLCSKTAGCQDRFRPIEVPE